MKAAQESIAPRLLAWHAKSGRHDLPWQQDRSARQAEVRQAAAAADLAERTFRRERELVATGASTAQQLDETRSARDQAASMHARARDLLGRAEAEKAAIEVARRDLEVRRQRRELAAAQLAELRVTLAKYTIRAPAVPAIVQTQFVWPGELAQPGTPVLSVLDPTDKYVQIYVPVADAGRMRVGQPVSIELDSEPGRRVRGEVSFIADQANFTPEKIETRADSLGRFSVKCCPGRNSRGCGRDGVGTCTSRSRRNGLVHPSSLSSGEASCGEAVLRLIRSKPWFPSPQSLRWERI